MKRIKWFFKLIKLAYKCSRASREIGVGDKLPKGVCFGELRSPAGQEAHKRILLLEHLGIYPAKRERINIDDSN